MMRFGMMYKQGDIVLLPVPFSDLTNRKQRPVLVISSDSYNDMTDDMVVVAITSQLRNLDYSVIIESIDLKEGTLKVTSAIRADKVYTLSKDIVRKKFGQVNTEVMEDVRKKVNELIK
ncbi:type II toxin-antitoxin system PemK/MazF family toxin [Aquibacillus koreensis]|uniref:Type II toxin-antitoxin system PemK/MazF family toxin n=1 Tax=Aquibacillus koreensis TaxID=279446 RepID=A0A9X3WIN8_9BACI|nr:type II toxin-antitoxin system PemK/MazF family toxin [Aquibacillus koreensis]MCT2534722.1 type II toxin-antitoxin system PemK/MazF family toxin [Aquibacillus koreensis]MDC3419668.1 type II toxin-antitoxin system PemK/MazF family toxin [Aquibacillus koreensis]